MQAEPSVFQRAKRLSRPINIRRQSLAEYDHLAVGLNDESLEEFVFQIGRLIVFEQVPADVAEPEPPAGRLLNRLDQS